MSGRLSRSVATDMNLGLCDVCMDANLVQMGMITLEEFIDRSNYTVNRLKCMLDDEKISLIFGGLTL